MTVLKQTIMKYQDAYGSTKTNNSEIPAVYDSTKTNNSEIPGCIWQY